MTNRSAPHRKNPSGYSLGVVLVALGNPRVRNDLRLSGFSPTASLDEVCATLAATGAHRFEVLRHNALVALGKQAASANRPFNFISYANPRVGLWVATQVLKVVASKRVRFSKPSVPLISFLEAACAGVPMASANADSLSRRILEREEEAFMFGGVSQSRNNADAAMAFRQAVLSVVRSNGVPNPMFAAASLDSSEKALFGTNRYDVAALIPSLVVSLPVWQGDPRNDPWPMPSLYIRR